MRSSDIRAKQHAALAKYRRLLVFLAIAGVAVTAAALLYLGSYGPLSATLVVTVVFGVFVSMLLGGGLMATGFYSSDSGIDEDVARSSTAAADPPTVPDSPRDR